MITKYEFIKQIRKYEIMFTIWIFLAGISLTLLMLELLYLNDLFLYKLETFLLIALFSIRALLNRAKALNYAYKVLITRQKISMEFIDNFNKGNTLDEYAYIIKYLLSVL